MDENFKKTPYFTWGCSDDLAFRLRKTLYFSEDDDCYESSSAALTDVAVSMLRETATCSRRKLSHRYASSLTRQLSISPCALMMSILYSERLRQLNPGYLERISSSDLYVVSMLVATKFLHDEGEREEIYNDEWAEAAGLAVSTMNRLEREFLDAMEWNIYVDPQEFLSFCSKIETRIAFKYGVQRGWFSYTDLTQCLLESNYQNVLKGIFEKTVKVIGGCALIYGMSLSLLASTVITYAATCTASQINTHTSLTRSSNLTTTTNGKNITPYNILFQTFSERKLSKRRTNRPVMNGNVNTDEESELELEYKLNQKENSTNPLFGHGDTENVKQKTHCNSGTDCRFCFESHFQHSLRQTKLFPGLDIMDTNYLCNNQKHLDLDIGGGGCNCNTQAPMSYDLNEIELRKLSSEGMFQFRNLGFGKKFHSLNFAHSPTVLGMVVM